ncbi:GATA transcription factor 9 [Hibiscus trionum]|uniref:GATA transcription factor n=1 Tax=Hibiscus trionum TaxID=183268 RepID=A0A9W7HNF7_HIBTR|nr:GATA transcription factor 9 [Hibiscus trionum]
MIGPTEFIDEIDCGSFFDHIDDLLDFPNDDVDAGLAASDSAVNAAAFPTIWTTQSESFPSSDSVFSNNSASDLSAELSVPYEDIVQLEWLSNFVDDSNCGASLTIMKQEPDSINKDSSNHDHHQFQTSSPVSVLESSSSCSGEKPVAGPGKCGRARSKRPRPATFNPRPAIQLMSPSSSVNDNGINVPHSSPIPRVPSDSENYAESRLLIKLPRQVNPEHKKKKKIKLTLPAPPTVNITAQNQSGQAVRKCMHCEITKTPQWRAGPMGPKTLCNACGVRYKSGRLFPEYRPAASPTFIPAIHSNSHKKVLEMRTKVGTADETTDSPEMIPNKSNPALDYIQREGLGFGEF